MKSSLLMNKFYWREYKAQQFKETFNVRPSVFPSVRPSVFCQSVRLYVRPSVPVHPRSSVRPSVPVRPSVRMPVRPFVCLSVSPFSVRLSVRPAVCMSVRPSVRLFHPLSVCLPLYVPLHYCKYLYRWDDGISRKNRPGKSTYSGILSP